MRNRRKVCFITAFIAVIAIPWILRWQANAKLRTEISSLRQMVKQIPKGKAEQERLSGLLTQLTNAQKNPKAEVHEVVNLRGAVESLRKQTNALGELAAENLKVSAALTALAKRSVGKTYPTEFWIYAGHNEPEDAIQSFLHAARTGNWTQIVDSATPGYRAWLEKQPKGDLTENLDETQNIKEYSITDGQPISDDIIILYVWFEYLKEQDGKHGYGAPVYLKRIQGKWKIEDPQTNAGK